MDVSRTPLDGNLMSIYYMNERRWRKVEIGETQSKNHQTQINDRKEDLMRELRHKYNRWKIRRQ